MREPLIALSAAIAARDRGRLLAALARTKWDEDPVAVDEILLQSHLFVGFPIALNAMALWRAMDGSLAQGAIEESESDWMRRGERVCAAVYGSNYERLRERVAALHPEADRWMVERGYGQVMGRPAVDLVTRELCVVALLAVWDTPEQLHSHLRGALNVGASVAEIDRALAIAAEHVDEDAARRSRELWDAVRSRRAKTDS
jgi:4-carboxymuconolactone decarboxylase